MISKLTAAVLLILGLALTATGAVLGYADLTRDGLDCGSAFSPEYSSDPLDVALFGGRACAEATSDRKTVALAVLVPGVVILLGGAVLGGIEIRRHYGELEASEAASEATD